MADRDSLQLEGSAGFCSRLIVPNDRYVFSSLTVIFEPDVKLLAR